MSTLNSYSTTGGGGNNGLSRSTTNHSFQHSLASNGESVLIDESDLSDTEHDHENNNDGEDFKDFNNHPFGMASASRVPSNAASMIFERTVEDPFVPINPHNNLTRTNSIVSLGNGRTNSIVSLHNLSRTNSNANIGNLFSSSSTNITNITNNNNNNNNNTYNTTNNPHTNIQNNNNLSRTNSWADMRAGSSPADINGRRSSMSIHRTLENYIAPSLDASAHLVSDKSTNLDQIQIQHLQSNGMYNNHPHRRPSTLGLYTTSGAATPIPTNSSSSNMSSSLQSAGNTQDEGMSSTSPISPLMSPSSPNLASTTSYISSSSSSASNSSGRPKILRMYSYADVLNDEKQFRRPSLSQSTSSSILLNTNSFNNGNSLGNSGTPTPLTTSNSSIGQGASFSLGSPLSSNHSQNSGTSPLVSPSFSKPISTGSNNGSHPLASNVINSDAINIKNSTPNTPHGRKGSSVGKDASPLSKRAIMTHHAVNKTGGINGEESLNSRRTSQGSGSAGGVFEKLKPEEYKQRQYGFDQGGKSPLHSLKN